MSSFSLSVLIPHDLLAYKCLEITKVAYVHISTGFTEYLSRLKRVYLYVRIVLPLASFIDKRRGRIKPFCACAVRTIIIIYRDGGDRAETLRWKTVKIVSQSDGHLGDGDPEARWLGPVSYYQIRFTGKL